MGDFRVQNGVVLEDIVGVSCCYSSEVWARAEEVTHEIIKQVQPTVVSEVRRKDVVDYVQRLLKGYLGCEVFPFGSVPLKTYLPDGDIDLTAFCGFNLEEAFANDVFSVLEDEDHNPAAEFVVKDVQLIRAEVKLVKCLVQNIVVDISFNQIGGLCTLCFLEEVDRLIGKDHLFKRSIILIKAWCYYESRILGAHHGLISTYALETLVLYIFHLFHSSLSGPLAVLHRFLEYFSNFDWENFCVSLNGPVLVSSSTEAAVEKPEFSGDDLLLSDDFMRDCVRKFSVPSRGNETNYRTFLSKHLNIVDPLKENNNLGRSVSKGNFFRIRSAFSYGARKLGQILLQPQENIAEEVRKFFTNTLDRHGKGQRPDVHDPVLISESNGFAHEIFSPTAGPGLDDNFLHEELSIDSHRQYSGNSVGYEDTRHSVVSKLGEPGTHLEGTDIDRHKIVHRSIPSRTSAVQLSEDGLSAYASRLGDAIDVAKQQIHDLRLADHRNKRPFLEEEARSSLPNVAYAPHLSISLPLENGKMENGDLCDEGPADASFVPLKRTWEPHMCHDGSTSRELEVSALRDDLYSNNCYSSKNSNANFFQDSLPLYQRSCSTSENREILNLHPDLSGEVDIHLDNLRRGRWWFDHGLQMTFQPVHMTVPLVFQPKNPWDTIRQSVPFRRDVAPQMNVPRSNFIPMNPPVTRGTGTYFPITNHHSYRDRYNVTKGRSQGQLKSPRTNGRGPSPMDRSPQMQSPGRHGAARAKSLDFYETSPRGKVYREVNGFTHIPEKDDELSAPVHPPVEVASQGESAAVDSAPSPGSQNGESVFAVNNDRLSMQSYHLKDDEDFPPLSV